MWHSAATTVTALLRIVGFPVAADHQPGAAWPKSLSANRAPSRGAHLRTSSKPTLGSHAGVIQLMAGEKAVAAMAAVWLDTTMVGFVHVAGIGRLTLPIRSISPLFDVITSAPCTGCSMPTAWHDRRRSSRAG
jgi:hypothetical protein